MNIFDHLIPDDLIVGIGPLMWQDHPLQEYAIAYGSKKYFFELHLAAHTTRIESDYFRTRIGNDEVAKMTKWKSDYAVLRKRIAIMVNEPDVMETRSAHLEEVKQVYESLKDNITNVIAGLEMAPTLRVEPVNERIATVYDQLEKLRDLACK